MSLVPTTRSRWSNVAAMAAVALALYVPSLKAADNDLLNLSLDELMQVEVLESAATYPVTMADAPAVIEVLTAEEIDALAPRTLGDLLAQIPGFMVQDDRVRARLSVRGVSLPGDENTRVLVLVDGHPLMEYWSGTSPVSELAGIAPSQIKRLEVVQGPGSVLLGSSALWATINIVTKDGADLGGILWDSDFEPENRTVRYALSWGRQSDRSDLALHLNHAASQGAHLTFGNPGDRYAGASNAGQALSGYLRWKYRQVSLTLSLADQGKHVPHEWYQSLRAYDENRYQEQNTIAVLGITQHLAGGRELTLRAFGSDYRGHWYYAVAPEDGSETQAWELWMDKGMARSVGLEAVYVHPYRDWFRSAFGLRTRWVQAEQHSGQRSIDDRQWAGDGDAIPPNAREQQFNVLDAYGTAQARLLPRWQVFGGAHFNRTYGEQRLTPKGGFILDAGRAWCLKAMAGEGFRTPSIYERSSSDDVTYIPNPDLTPEIVRTVEVTLLKALAGAAGGDAENGLQPRASLTAYVNRLKSIISMENVPRENTFHAGDTTYADTLIQFVNVGSVEALGVQLALRDLSLAEWRLSGHVSLQRTENEAEESTLGNSPEWLGLVRVLRTRGEWISSLEGRYVGRRDSYAGRGLASITTAHLFVAWRPRNAPLEVGLRVDNLFDAPGKVALFQPDYTPLETVAIDGRVFTIHLQAHL